ncbi:MAG: tetratricopeptide repeat protein [Treponema sp.]|nr:tetratricopeptide repeat protein [Treponema sp.]
MNRFRPALCAVATFFLFVTVLWAQPEKPDALKLYNEGKYAEAVRICESEIEATPDNMNSYSVLCWALVANRQYREAEQRASEAYQKNTYDVRIMEVLGEAKYFLGKNDEALNMFQRYIANVPENGNRVGRVYYYMGEIYIKQARYEHADISLTTAVRNDPLRDYWWTRLGYAREMTRDWRSAITAYDRAIELNAAQADARKGKARCQEHLQ